MTTQKIRLEPGLSVQERLVKLNWLGGVWRSDVGTPFLSADFIARQGRSVRLIDVRTAEELTGPLGHIPGVEWVALEAIATVADRYEAGTPVVVISQKGGRRAAEAARQLECAGMTFVAVMDGGMVAWKKMGFATARVEDVLTREPTAPPAALPTEAAAGPLTRARIEAHIGDPRSVRWVKMAALLLHTKVSCVDGRDDHGVIGTPGGNAGEFLVALAAIERVTGTPFPLERLPQVLHSYIDTFGHFYVHSDTIAANDLIKSMRADRRLDEHLPPITSNAQDWREYMASPPRAAHELILEHIAAPGHVGCGHLRLMLQNSEKYLVRRELVEAFLRTYFKMRWEGVLELDYVILGGGHQEGAVVNIRVAGGVWPFTRVPLISPACGATQMFVNHPQVAEFMRDQVARFFSIHPDFLPVGESHFGMLQKDMRRIAGIQLGHTLAALAKGLPIFDVVFRSEQEFSVEEVGAVAG
ncbi:MAG: rhodanese-like domain-containing protein [Myxococcales bacterium]|nr:rhodanese-like domain-containing protein [Myxococcales bacterium]